MTFVCIGVDLFISRRRYTPSLHPQKTYLYKTSIYAFAHFTGTESTYYVQHLMRSFQLDCFIYFGEEAEE